MKRFFVNRIFVLLWKTKINNGCFFGFIVAFMMLGIVGIQFVPAGEHGNYGALLKALPESKHALADGIRQVTKAQEVAISAKFELDDKGQLSLSIYTAEKGLAVDAENNILKEVSGNPEAIKWTTEVEVFKDVPHVARSAQHLNLMRLSKFSLLDIIKKAEKEHKGIIFSITPVIQDRTAQFVVLVADKDKVVELRYDSMTGKLVRGKQ